MEKVIYLGELTFLKFINDYWKVYVIANMKQTDSANMFLFSKMLREIFISSHYQFKYDMANDKWILKDKEDE